MLLANRRSLKPLSFRTTKTHKQTHKHIARPGIVWCFWRGAFQSVRFTELYLFSDRLTAWRFEDLCAQRSQTVCWGHTIVLGVLESVYWEENEHWHWRRCFVLSHDSSCLAAGDGELDFGWDWNVKPVFFCRVVIFSERTKIFLQSW